jgi:hypothetical protein
MSAGRSIRKPPRLRGRGRSKVRQVGILPCRNQSWQPQDAGVNRKPSGLKKGWLVRTIGRASIEARNSIAMRDNVVRRQFSQQLPVRRRERASKADDRTRPT